VVGSIVLLRDINEGNSKRIFSERIAFKMYLQKRLKKDIKPEVLSFISEIKAKGLSSGAGREISTLHFDTYK